MDENRKATFWRDENGYYKDWVMPVVFVLIVVGVFCFTIGMVAVGDYYEVKAFNRIHGTDYTFGEWFWAQQTLKDYHLGTVENKNYDVDLNINGDKEICLSSG